MGIDAETGITYTLLSISGRRLDGNEQPRPAPRLTAQCTRTAAGKLKFEMLADMGGIITIAYYPPWRPTSQKDLFPPRLEQIPVTMEFLGYTKVKPVRRQWDYVRELAGEMRYAAPGGSSSNMEEITFYLQYMRSLPTLRLIVPGKGAAEWDTSQWQSAIHAEPLCAAGGV